LIADIKEVREDLEVNLCILVMEINFATFFFLQLLMVENPNCSDFCASNPVVFSSFGTCKTTGMPLHFSEKKLGQIARPNFLRTSSGQLKGICKTQILWEKSSFDSLFLVIFIREKLHLQIDFTSICCRKPLPPGSLT